jgi:hypothetical protein
MVKLPAPLSRFLKLILLFAIGLCLSSIPLYAQTVNEAKIKEIIDGNQVFIQNQQAKVNDVAKQRQRVRTGDARAELVFNTGVTARLAKNSLLTVGQCARLQQGTLLVNGAINGCTASIVAAVRGTTYVLEVDESGKQEVKVLEGEVAVRQEPTPDFAEGADPKQWQKLQPFHQLKQLTNTPEPVPTPETRPLPPLEAKPAEPAPPVLSQPQSEVILKAGEKLDIDAKGVLSIVQKLSQAEFESLLTGALFQGFSEQLSSIDKIRRSFEGLFPGVSFPIPSLPSLPTPSVPSLPSLPF